MTAGGEPCTVCAYEWDQASLHLHRMHLRNQDCWGIACTKFRSALWSTDAGHWHRSLACIEGGFGIWLLHVHIPD